MNPKLFRIMLVILAILILVTVVVHCSGGDEEGSEYVPLTLKQMEELPDDSLAMRVTSDTVARVYGRGTDVKKNAWRSLSEEQQISFAIGVFGMRLQMFHGYLQWFIMRSDTSPDIELADLANAYEKVGCKATAAALREAETLAGQPETQKYIEQIREMVRTEFVAGEKPPTNPFQKADNRLREAAAKDKADAQVTKWLRANLAAIAGEQGKK
jgi:hypothetical protein